MNPIKPMEPVLYHEAFDDPAYVFQVKWDGVRSLAYADGAVRLINRHLNDRTAQYPEITEALAGLPEGTVLDGELVALGGSGKPDFYRVMKRELCKAPGKIADLRRRVPAFYMVFDVIAWDGEDYTGRPLAERQQRLGDLAESDHVGVVESVPERGRALWELVEAQDLEGIVAKRADSPYLIGMKSALWKKIKVWRNMDASVGGWSEETGRVRSLALGIQEEEELTYIGNVGTGFTEHQWKAIGEYLRAANGTDAKCPFVNRPWDKTLYWAKPELVVTVRYREIGSDGGLRHPVAVGIKQMEGV